VEVLEGIDHLSPPSDREKQTLAAVGAPDNYRLACQCQVLGDVQLDYVPLLDPRRKPKTPEGGTDPSKNP
jgi:ferredoxin